MSINRNRIGIDVGGSHISAAVIGKTEDSWEPTLKKRLTLNSHDSASNIVTTLSNCIKALRTEAQEIEAVGIAFPGPFDYENGISAVINVGGKFEKTFGLHIKQVLEDFTGLRHTVFKFYNDAYCFATGAYSLHHLNSKRTVFITLGTGFGSGYLLDGELLHSHPDIPPSGALYDQDFFGSKS